MVTDCTKTDATLESEQDDEIRLARAVIAQAVIRIGKAAEERPRSDDRQNELEMALRELALVTGNVARALELG